MLAMLLERAEYVIIGETLSNEDLIRSPFNSDLVAIKYLSIDG